MILVNLSKSWQEVQAGVRTPEEVTLRAWHGITDQSLHRYADAVLGIYREEVVTAYDITGWARTSDGRVAFEGEESAKWAHLIGTNNPGAEWVRGAARPVKYLDTAILTGGNVTAEPTDAGQRAVIDGITLTVAKNGNAAVLLPVGRQLTVQTV